MTTRAKFRCESVEQVCHSANDWVKNPDGTFDYGRPTSHVTRWNVKMSPVCPSGPGNQENKSFWEASPSGSFVLGTIKDHGFVVGRDYYLDISEAPQ